MAVLAPILNVQAVDRSAIGSTGQHVVQGARYPVATGAKKQRRSGPALHIAGALTAAVVTATYQGESYFDKAETAEVVVWFFLI
jgi:hypothetical protein